MYHQRFGGDSHANGRAFDQSYQMVQNSSQAYTYPAVQDTRHLHSDANHMYLFGPASIPSSSPDSLTFSSDGVSQVNQPSYLNTPSTSNADLPRHGSGGFLEQAQIKKIGNNGSKLKAWVHFDAANPPGKKSKSWRKCYSCFVRKQKCEDGADPTRCLSCKDSHSYCKGPIRMPLFIEIDTLKGIAALAFQYHQLEPQPVIERSLPVQMPQLLTDFPYISELPAAHEMLDILWAFDQVPPRPVKVGGVDLTRFENLCRRFCACLVLLRNLNSCKIDAKNQSYRHIYRLALGFVLRLSLLANDLLKEVFEEVRACCQASRQTSQTPRLMGDLASFLGQILTEIRHLRRYGQSFPKLPLLQILEPVCATESGIIFYGKSFDDDEFITGSRLDSRILPGIHLQISGSFFPDQKCVKEIPLTAWPSVLGVLSLDLTSNASRNEVNNASKVKTTTSTIQNHGDTGLPNAIDTYPYSSLAVRHGVLVPQAPISYEAVSDTVENRVARLQSEKVEIQLDIDWLQKLVLDKDKDIKALGGSLIPSDNLFDEPFGKQYSPYKSPEDGDRETDTLVQAEPNLETAVDVFNSIDLDEAWTTIQEQFPQSLLDERDLDIDMQDTTDMDESSQRRKRKRVSPTATPKKQTNGTQPEDGVAFVAVAEKASKNTSTTDIQMPYSKPRKRSSTIMNLKKHVSGAHGDQGQPLNNENTATVEISDLNDTDEPDLQDCPHYERRPKTWPLRQAFRQSVDISVKTIVRGFEKLRLD